MRGAFFWFLSFGGFAAVSLVCGLLVWPQLVAAWPSIEEKIDRFRRLPLLAKLVLLLFVGAFVVYGSTKTNQVDQTSGTNIVEIVEGGTNNGQRGQSPCWQRGVWLPVPIGSLTDRRASEMPFNYICKQVRLF